MTDHTNNSIQHNEENQSLQLTEAQKTFISLMIKQGDEARSDDLVHYYLEVKGADGKWAKRYWLRADLLPLIEQNYLIEFPNRWNREHKVIVLNRAYPSTMKELKAALKRPVAAGRGGGSRD